MYSMGRAPIDYLDDIGYRTKIAIIPSVHSDDFLTDGRHSGAFAATFWAAAKLKNEV